MEKASQYLLKTKSKNKMDEEKLERTQSAIAEQKVMAFYKRLQLRLLDGLKSDMYLRDEVMLIIKEEYDRE